MRVQIPPRSQNHYQFTARGSQSRIRTRQTRRCRESGNRASVTINVPLVYERYSIPSDQAAKGLNSFYDPINMEKTPNKANQPHIWGRFFFIDRSLCAICAPFKPPRKSQVVI
jgi:hypothetical protein